LVNPLLSTTFGNGVARAVDAKENLTLADRQESCYLTIVDEKSGAYRTADAVSFARFPPMDVFVKYPLKNLDKKYLPHFTDGVNVVPCVLIAERRPMQAIKIRHQP
jgi:hypothetical protein